ncbi:MAG: hypothetical protein U0105_18450 [Candidatus Obscuribacterales bacterium]
MVNKGDIFIGDLLVQAGFASFEEVADALPIAAKTGLPVGRVLVGSKSISDSELQATLFAQSLLRDRLLSNDMALQAMRKVRIDGTTLYEALEELGWKSESYELTNRLGQLLLDAQMVTQPVLEEALEAFYTTGLPMARILVLKGVISNHLAYTAITTQMMLRDGLLSREQAIDALKKAASKRASTDSPSDYSNYLRIQPMHTLRIGELLVLARQVSELDLLEAVERSLFTDEPIGETLVRTHKVTRSTLEQGLRAQKLITSGELTPLEAAELLRRIHASDLTFDEAFAEVKGTPEERAEALGLFRGDQGVGADGQKPAKSAPAAQAAKAAPTAEEKSAAEAETPAPEDAPPVLDVETPASEGLPLSEDAPPAAPVEAPAEVQAEPPAEIHAEAPPPAPESSISFEDNLTPEAGELPMTDAEAAAAMAAGATPDPGLEALEEMLKNTESAPAKETSESGAEENGGDNGLVMMESHLHKGSALEVAVAERIQSMPANMRSVSDLVKLVELLVGKVEQLSGRVGQLESELKARTQELEQLKDKPPPVVETPPPEPPKPVLKQPKSLKRIRN